MCRIIINNLCEIPLTHSDKLQEGPTKAGMIHIYDLAAQLRTSYGSRTPYTRHQDPIVGAYDGVRRHRAQCRTAQDTACELAYVTVKRVVPTKNNAHTPHGALHTAKQRLTPAKQINET